MNNELCASVKSKGSDVQCPKSRKENSEFCGIHLRVFNKNPDNLVRFNGQNIQLSVKKVRTNTSAVKKTSMYNSDDIKTIPKQRLNYGSLKSTANQLCLSSYYGESMPKNKDQLYEKIKEYYDKIHIYEKNVDLIVKIQSVVRMHFVRKRSKCVNQSEFLTLESKYDIDPRYYFEFKDQDGFWYCFDINSFKHMVESNVGELTNPYTNKVIDQRVLDEFKEQMKTVKEPVIEQPKLTEEQQYKQKVLSVFQKFDMLDNYTDQKWFLDLTMTQLISLYIVAQDVFHYRAMLPDSVRCSLAPNGSAFMMPQHAIKHYSSAKKRQLQNMILNEFDKVVSYSDDENTRKLGAMLMLTALCDVSHDAAIALPQYAQNIQ